MAACRVLDEATPSPCPWEGEGAGGEGLRLLDGQMGVEDVSPLSPPGERGRGEGSKSGSPFQTDELVTRYGIGARGIEVVSLLPLSANESCRGEGAGGGASETFGFPLYDTHGNMVATLGRSGSSFTLGNEQSYDVWGTVRSSSSSEEQGYVANLGHRADPESFLTYMRARYYEPHTGRFISEDPKESGINNFIYASNAPSVNIDFDGQEDQPAWLQTVLKTLLDFWNSLSPIVQIMAGAVIYGAIGLVQKKVGKMARAALGNYLMNVGRNFLKQGFNDIAVAALAFAHGMSGGSLGQMAGSWTGGGRYAVSGAMKIALGIMFYYLGVFLRWIDS